MPLFFWFYLSIDQGRNPGKNFVDFFWRFEDTKRTFWNQLNFRYIQFLTASFWNFGFRISYDIRSFPISFSHWSQAWLPQLLRIFFQCKPVFIYKRKSGKFSKTKFNLISTIYRFARGPLWVHPAASHRQWAGKTSLWRLRLKRKRLLKEVNRFYVF